MALYECVLIARQDISAAQAEQLSEQFAQIVRDNGGTIAKSEYWGLKTLTYKIKKNRKGHYTLFNIDAPAAAVAEMERNMSISEDVLRFMTVRVDALDANPSAMMQSRNERGERGDRGDRGPRRFDDRGPRPPRRQENVAAAEGETA
ncbi:small subunit ribosomal protein S6 [Azospirillum oryzae]|jgi:small subunit ribosomal protein S6|uniref:Small ribosomal subunit protein bS6 n=1 Tax=Azospirillum oryzae TaxID=286727 RepID=A0A1X7GQS9_9PROT|nr:MULTISPECIES: 30S ribosomal protein S6 [Azospirillum]KAA0591093.1 30S ribosomal protein S6 [Azospirillum oryzae]MCM8733385.1 30S ribosomal protein S6 [Azospirillum sp. A1-3]MDR6770452.1 small subunit ribosomal protein S6 [Azospirillum sp. BE72]PWC57200.1 30S ribosomal protein S6 [Azospirillum sp. TSH7]PWC69206.1 30S ribosomal protein S6 [Azospirillum sp. TSH20]